MILAEIVAKTEDAVAVGSSALLACVFCFIVSFIFIGLPLGHLLGMRRARREFADYLRSAGVDHITKLGEDRMPLIVYLSAQLCIGYRLLFLKSKLLLQQTLLKTIGQAARQPCAKQSAKSNAPSAGEKSFVCHKSVVTQANVQSSGTRGG